MGENENTRVDMVVALVMNAERQCLWIWNEAWGAFALPMTKRRSGAGLDELPARAAARAGAEALGVPVRVGAHWAAIPAPKVSGRDLALRTYAYEVFRVASHPKYADASQVRPPHLWLTTDEAFSGEFQPLASASLEVLAAVIEQGRFPARTQHTSVLILRRDDREGPRFHLRWNERWGYALPSGRRAPQDDPLATAERVAREELGLNPGRDVTLTRAGRDADHPRQFPERGPPDLLPPRTVRRRPRARRPPDLVRAADLGQPGRDPPGNNARPGRRPGPARSPSRSHLPDRLSTPGRVGRAALDRYQPVRPGLIDLSRCPCGLRTEVTVTVRQPDESAPTSCQERLPPSR
jgi:hypothetical protein